MADTTPTSVDTAFQKCFTGVSNYINPFVKLRNPSSCGNLSNIRVLSKFSVIRRQNGVIFAYILDKNPEKREDTRISRQNTINKRMLIGNRLRKLRELRNYTQEYVARELNMTATGYGKIERDESEVSFQKLKKIATILDVKVEDIINFSESMVFNVMNGQIGTKPEATGIAGAGLSDSEKRLYEQIIEQLKEENAYLKTIIDRLQRK